MCVSHTVKPMLETIYIKHPGPFGGKYFVMFIIINVTCFMQPPALKCHFTLSLERLLK